MILLAPNQSFIHFSNFHTQKNQYPSNKILNLDLNVIPNTGILEKKRGGGGRDWEQERKCYHGLVVERKALHLAKRIGGGGHALEDHPRLPLVLQRLERLHLQYLPKLREHRMQRLLQLCETTNQSEKRFVLPARSKQKVLERVCVRVSEWVSTFELDLLVEVVDVYGHIRRDFIACSDLCHLRLLSLSNPIF